MPLVLYLFMYLFSFAGNICNAIYIFHKVCWTNVEYVISISRHPVKHCVQKVCTGALLAIYKHDHNARYFVDVCLGNYLTM